MLSSFSLKNKSTLDTKTPDLSYSNVCATELDLFSRLSMLSITDSASVSDTVFALIIGIHFS